MKSACAFSVGLLAGSLGTGIVLWVKDRRERSVPVRALSEIAGASAATMRVSSSPSGGAPELTAPALEQALREIRDAGMIVIPQELLRLLTPNMVSVTNSPELRDAFRLDQRETNAIHAARRKLGAKLAEAAGKTVVISRPQPDKTVVAVTVPPETRTQLVASTRREILDALDAESAALFTHLDMSEGSFTASDVGLSQGTVSIRPRKSTGYEVTITEGVYTQVHKLTGEQLIRLYPSLRDKLPVLANP